MRAKVDPRREKRATETVLELAQRVAFADILFDYVAKKNGGWLPGDRESFDRWREREVRRRMSALNRVRLGDPSPSGDPMEVVAQAVYDCGERHHVLGETAVEWRVVRAYLMALWGWSYDLAEAVMWAAFEDAFASAEPPEEWPVTLLGDELLLQPNNVDLVKGCR